MSYQVFSGIKTFAGSDTWTELFYIGHSHSVQIQYMIVENNTWSNGGCHGECSWFTTYGNNSGPVNHTLRRNAQNAGTISSDPTLQYQNSGGSVSYLIRAKVSYSGSNPFTIRYVVRGLSSGNFYGL